MSALESFFAVAARQPDAPAIGELGYAALADRARRIGTALRERGAGPEGIVALSLPRGPELVAALLGTWCAGAAFTILDRALPPRRREAIVDRLHRAGVLAAKLDTLDAVAAASRSAPSTPALPRPESLAYLCWSSGSTGAPKGVLVEHRGLPSMLEQQIAAFELGPDDCALWMLRAGFDASISDVLTALLAGAQLRVAPEGAAAVPWIHSAAAAGVTHIDLPPALLPHLDPERWPETLRTVIVGGEVAPMPAMRALSERLRLICVYGPAEATICTSLCVVGPDWDRALIGQPLHGVRYRVLPERGELAILGPQVARGYFDDPELTAQRFVTLPEGRAFLSGDRIQREIDGEYRYVGRIDRQLKRRGQLVAPEEVEAVLQSRREISRAHVGVDAETDRLVAWIECRAADWDDGAIFDALRQQLPAWACPAELRRVDRLPLTVSGKVDVPALTAPAEGGSAPQQILAAMAARVLRVAKVDLSRSFPDQGGDSLAALELAAAMAGLGVDLGPSQIDDLNTPLGALLGQGTPESVALEPPSHAPGAPTERPTLPPRRVLVLGANGYLGARVVAALQCAGVAEIFASARCRMGRSARGRIQAALEAQGLPGVDFRAVDLESGDALPGGLDAVFNCTGRANSAASYESLEADNVGPLREILPLLPADCALHHASTLSVLLPLDRSPGEVRETPVTNAAGLSSYARSKVAAEHLLRASPVTATIHRFGLLTGDLETARGAEGSLLSRLIAGLVRLGAVPSAWLEHLEMDITPVDFAAEAMVRLAMQAIPAPGEAPRILHIAGARPVTLAQWVTALEAEGHPIERLDGADELDRRVRAGGVLEAAAALALCRGFGGERFAVQHALDMFEATGARFDCSHSEAQGIERPAPDVELLRRYVRHFLGEHRL